MKFPRIRFRKKEKKQKPVKKEKIPKEVIDTIQEQIEKPQTTIHCPESIKGDELKKVKQNPEEYIEINMVKKIRIVDNYYISANDKTFKYRKKSYTIDEANIYLLPTKSGYFMPTCFYYEGEDKATSFKQKNKGITGKALSLLYDENLYVDLFSGEEGRYNFIIIILSIVSLVAYAVGLYLLFGGEV